MKPLIPFILLWTSCSVVAAADINPSQLPVEVKKAIAHHAPGAVVERVEKEEDDFVIHVKQAGQPRELRIADDGVLASIQIALSEAPAAVQKTVQQQSGKVEFVAKTFEGKETAFEVDIRTAEGLQRSYEVNPSGKLTSIQLAEREVPAHIAKAVEANRGGARLLGVHKLTAAGGITYAAELEKDGKTRDMVVTADGKLESIQLALTEVPVPAQKTIKEKIGTGKLVRIDKVLEKGSELFAVEGRKNGKPFNFSVGPKGRFLGMDE